MLEEAGNVLLHDTTVNHYFWDDTELNDLI